MPEIVLRAQKAEGLTNQEVDANFLVIKAFNELVHQKMNALANERFLRPVTPYVPQLTLRTETNLRLSNEMLDENFRQAKRAVEVALANVAQLAQDAAVPLGYLPTYVHVNLRTLAPGPLAARFVDASFINLRDALLKADQAIEEIRNYEYESPSEVVPVDGIFWQTLLNNVDLRRDWDRLGASTTILQWVAVDGQSFIEQNILPQYNQLIDLDDLATYPFAQEIIIGTPGIFNEVNARASASQLADLAQQFGALPYPENVKGFYFPIEIDPTWTDAPQVLAPLWDKLPRPLNISVYYGQNIDGYEAANWIASFLPPDVTVLFQDGCGAFDFDPLLALLRFRQLQDVLGPERVVMIFEAFKRNPDYAGVDGTYFIPLTIDEYKYRASLYRDIKTYVFDAPNYLTSEFIQRANNQIPVFPPINLSVTCDSWGDSRLSWERQIEPGQVAPSRYNVQLRDGTGNNIVREFTVPGNTTSGTYPLTYAVEDFGFAPTFMVWRIQEVTETGYSSDYSDLYVGAVSVDDSHIEKAVAFLGHSGVEHMFSTMSGTSKADGAAAAFRETYAQEMGLDPTAVLPINCGYSGSVMDRRATPGANYWWDLEGNAPGPRLTQAVRTIQDTGKVVKDIYWFAGRDDAMAMTSGRIPGTFSSIDRTRLAMNAIFQYLREQLGNDVVFWLQGQPRSYVGEPPNEWFYDELSAITQLGIDLATIDPNVRIVSWGPDAVSGPDGYVVEDVGVSNTRAHFTPEVYRENARIVARNMAAGTSVHTQVPAWRFLESLTNITPIRRLNDDIEVTWDAVPGATYRYQNKDAVTGVVFDSGDLSTNTFTFTREQQIAYYGFTAQLLNLTLWSVTPEGIESPSSTFFAEVPLEEIVDPDPPEETFDPIVGFKAQQVGEDIHFTWDASPTPGMEYYYQNLRVDQAGVISEGVLTEPIYVFTAEAQRATYGFTASMVSFKVSEYSSETQEAGPQHVFAGNPQESL